MVVETVALLEDGSSAQTSPSVPEMRLCRPGLSCTF
jgi:hypothetical protein